MNVILMLGPVEDNPAAHFFRELLHGLEGAPKVVEVGDEFIQEQTRAHDDVNANHPELLDEDNDWTDAASSLVERHLLSWVSNEYLEGAEPANVIKAIFIVDGESDWWPLEETIDMEKVMHF